MKTPRERDLEEAAALRAKLARELELAQKANDIAHMLQNPGGAVLRELLENHVEAWEKRYSWEDELSLREQGKARRSREILRYLNEAPEAYKRHMEEARRLGSVLAAHEESGRIPRVEEGR